MYCWQLTVGAIEPKSQIELTHVYKSNWLSNKNKIHLFYYCFSEIRAAVGNLQFLRLGSRAWLQSSRASTRNSRAVVRFIAGECGTGAANCAVVREKGQVPEIYGDCEGSARKRGAWYFMCVLFLVLDISLAFAFVIGAAHYKICLATQILPSYWRKLSVSFLNGSWQLTGCEDVLRNETGYRVSLDGQMWLLLLYWTKFVP
jgi:hypothetical protein